jgi:hypothetical protein
MDAAEFVIRNIGDQIDAFRDVAAKMRGDLDALPAEQRVPDRSRQRGDAQGKGR